MDQMAKSPEQGQIHSYCDQLTKTLNELRELLDQLNHKLAPVMSQEPPASVTDESDRKALCPLAEVMFGLLQRLESDRAVVSNMLERLEI